VSNLIEAPRPSLLSDQSLGVVEATAPVVAAHADEITAHFYPRMFAAHPELLRVFNQGNQATGEQSKALAGSVVAYAVQLIDPKAPSFDHVMRRIAYKHVSLGIRPEQYTIVGEHLLASVAEVLGDAVTPEIAAAWSEVYWLFALQLVAEALPAGERGPLATDSALPRGPPHRGDRRRDHSGRRTSRRRSPRNDRTRTVRLGFRRPARR
jgi:hemoglobin-like flavoprotein